MSKDTAARFRQVRLSRVAVQAAVRRGEHVARLWQERYNGGSSWQEIGVELIILPAVWNQITALACHEGRSVYYGPVTRVVGYGLPGYVLRGWNSPPRDDWQGSHSAGTVCDGLRREVCGDLGWTLYAKAIDVLGQLDRPLLSESIDQHLARYRISFPT